MTPRHCLTILSLVACVACSSDETAGPDGSVDYQGSWTGTMGDPAQVSRNLVQWTATHSHNAVTGVFVIQLNSTVSATGTLHGTVADDLIDFTLDVPAGGFPSPVSPACVLTGSGTTTTATAVSIVANLALTFTAPCLGTVTGVLNANTRVTLTKPN